MDRRAFLTSTGGGAAAAAALSMFPTKMYSQSSSPNPIYTTSNTVGALTTGNTIVSPTTSANNWNAYRNTLVTLASDWQSNNYDSQLAAYYAALTPSVCKTANLDQAQILANVQATYPSVTLAQMQSYWATIDSVSEVDVQMVISNLQGGGMLPYLNGAIQSAASFSQTASTAATTASSRGMSPLSRSIPVPIEPAPACSRAAVYTGAALTIAFLTIGVMSGVGVIGMGFAYWGAVAAWGGGATSVFGVGQVAFC